MQYRHSIKWASVIILSVIGMVAAPATAGDLSWKGCGISRKAFMKACAEAYEKETGVKFKVSGGGATKGIKAAGKGAADFGGTCRHCLSVLKEDKLDLRLAIAAWDALVPIVNPANPIGSLTKQQVIGILKQEITDWKEVGGTPGPILVLVRKGKTSGVGYMTRKLILGDDQADFGSDVVTYKSSGPVEQQIEAKLGAFAITGVSSARLRKVKILSVDGVEPSKQNIASGDYPYFRPLYLAYKPSLNEDGRKFLKWLLSDKGQAIIGEQGTVTLRDGANLVAKYQHFGNRDIIDNFSNIQ